MIITLKTISNVEIINGDTVKITMVAALVGTATVSYGTTNTIPYQNLFCQLLRGNTSKRSGFNIIHFTGDITSEFIKANDGAFRLFKWAILQINYYQKVELIQYGLNC
jgi:hypothetical protein